MCGIVGIYNYKNGKRPDKKLVGSILDSLRHRGPDGSGIYIDPNYAVAFGHRRLSIIDCSGGGQPMSDNRKTVWLTFNGEIYNFRELKHELEKKGYKFRTNSDTEVIIYLYEEFGENCFEKLNGMFALALFDRKKQVLIIVRDRFGIKPVYYSYTSSGLVFGSEVSAILMHPDYKKALDFDALNSFLTLRYNPSPQTLFKGIFKLPPATLLRISKNGKVEEKKFIQHSATVNKKINFPEAVEDFRFLLKKAVKRQAETADFPVGLFLSGGVDSAAIGHIMQEISQKPVQTFSIGFSDEPNFNELREAKEISRLIGSKHRQISISKRDYLRTLSKSIISTEEPIAQSTIPALYLLSEFTSQFAKVAISGQGADELLGGYQRYIGAGFIFDHPLLSKLISSLVPSRIEKFKRAKFALQFADPFDKIMGVYTIFTPQEKESLLRVETASAHEEILRGIYKSSKNLDSDLAKILFLDSRAMLPDNLLLFNDKVTMAHSLENRFPFLDQDLVDFLETLPIKYKINLTSQKIIQKRAISDWFPKKIVRRKKNPFATPMTRWLKNGLAKKFLDVIEKKDSACTNFFNVDYIRRMVYLHSAGKADYGRHLLILIFFEIWYKYFFDGNIIEI